MLFTEHRDLLFGHRLEHRRLRLRRRAIDLVGEEQRGEDRAALEPQPSVAGRHQRAGDVGRHQIRRELDASGLQVHDLREAFDELGLAEAGVSLEQHVSAAQQRGERELDDGLDAVQLFGDGVDDMCGVPPGVGYIHSEGLRPSLPTRSLATSSTCAAVGRSSSASAARARAWPARSAQTRSRGAPERRAPRRLPSPCASCPSDRRQVNRHVPARTPAAPPRSPCQDSRARQAARSGSPRAVAPHRPCRTRAVRLRVRPNRPIDLRPTTMRRPIPPSHCLHRRHLLPVRQLPGRRPRCRRLAPTRPHRR